MRSLLVQASSVERAVEKAWATAGMPTEFTIKVHDFGKKGFLGITKKPAIISIVYEPQRQTSISRAPQQQKPQRPQQTQQQRPPQQTRQPRQPHQARPEARQQRPKELLPKKTLPTQAPTPTPVQPKIFWTDTLIDDITSWLTEITKTIGLPSSFKVESDKKILTITFDSDVMPSQDEERLLFSGLSYLLIQFLKKKHKKKYQGYRLMLTSKRFTSSDSSPKR
ncbi:Jag N-terminal domain-containing protein [Candidatus Dependentiae bacterium]|nr:Jag N-terminal domain-containing protein [Candidatus Dependentiae bacterium]